MRDAARMASSALPRFLDPSRQPEADDPNPLVAARNTGDRRLGGQQRSSSPASRNVCSTPVEMLGSSRRASACAAIDCSNSPQ